jgi:hypothetical protein
MKDDRGWKWLWVEGRDGRGRRWKRAEMKEGRGFTSSTSKPSGIFFFLVRIFGMAEGREKVGIRRVVGL